MPTLIEVNLDNEKIDRAAEYFEVKKILKTLRADLKDKLGQQEETEELEQLAKKQKEIKIRLADKQEIRDLRDKISYELERLNLIKEIIRVELIENNLEEVVKDSGLLRLQKVLKEFKSKDRRITPHPDQMSLS